MATLKVIYDLIPAAPGVVRKYHDDYALADTINYILNPDKTPGGFVGGYAVNIKQAAYEMEDIARLYGKDTGVRLRHFVLSFSAEETKRFRKHVSAVLHKIAGYAAGYYGAEYQIVWAVHENTDSPHIHFVMNTVSYVTGKKYRGDKRDYYGFQEYLKQFLWKQCGLHLTTVAME